MGAKINSPDKLKERFDKSGRTATKYARAKGFNITAVRRVLEGVTSGVSGRDGETRRILIRLKEDGIWIGRLPWEEKDGVYAKKAS